MNPRLSFPVAPPTTLTLRGRSLTDAFYGEYSGYPTANVYIGASRSVEGALATRVPMTAPRRSAAARARSLVRRVHLWLAVSVGLPFAVLGLTGSALVFYTGIDAALHPAIRVGADRTAPDLASPVWDRAVATGRARWHGSGGKWTIEVTGRGGAIPTRYHPASGTAIMVTGRWCGSRPTAPASSVPRRGAAI